MQRENRHRVAGGELTGHRGRDEAAAIPSDADWNADGHPIVAVTAEAMTDLVRAARRFLGF